MTKENFLEEKYQEDLQITNLNNVLKISVYLENKPGTLAEFAKLLKKHEANVIYMIYNEVISENRCEIAFYVKKPEQINSLAHEMNILGYYYNFEYSGADEEKTNKIIGLNLLERFFLNLKKIIGEEEIEKVKEIVMTSKKLSETLVNFNRESGKNLETGQIFNKILVFAISSLSKTKNNFSYKRLPTLPIGDVLLHSFRPPTGGTIYILEGKTETIMIDGTYGIYYEDVKRMLLENHIDPSKIKKIYITHVDADHVGLSGYFEEEYKTEVYLHPSSKGIIENENRAYGTDTPLFQLNHYFTILVNYFTKPKFPKIGKFFDTKPKEFFEAFPVIDYFKLDGTEFKVLESLGGHIPGQVFFLSEELGLFFTGDYLLYIPSLGKEEKSFLNIPKLLMTSTNINSKIFREELEQLKNLAKKIDSQLAKKGKGLLILPGHGDYYPIRLIS
ncbi:MAG: MBL fold metallo-hydrolase [Thermodesulfobacterium geofontis]|uniref:MBL fold metallo-hydrolase n=2 Tax=Thermodesulfobacterium geofontis TaxID=1295609 RepID=A0A2N7PMZ7_9BACT|nr:MAG: MBL fold metallo-hydrolase [Thermodesulfobacterium geofontis]